MCYMKDNRWYAFMATDTWVVFMNLMRILLFVAMIILIFIMVKNIEEVKTIASPCAMCTEKTGAICMIRIDKTNSGGFDFTNLTINIEP